MLPTIQQRGAFMHRRTFNSIFLVASFLAASVSSAAESSHHSLWLLHGKSNSVYLLGSVHFLNPNEQLPEVIDGAYKNAEAIVMEIDMDDLDPLEAQEVVMQLGMLPPDQTLDKVIGEPIYSELAEQAEKLGLDESMLSHFRPWFAGLTLAQLNLRAAGLDPDSGVEKRLTTLAARDHKPIEGLETLQEQLGLLANLPPKQERELVTYMLADAEHISDEIDTLLNAWRAGDSAGLEKLLTKDLSEHPNLIQPLTTDRNRKWLPKIEHLLDDSKDYLVVVGALHLVGKNSVIDLLQRDGHKVEQL
jgi:uncharacterized protein YbaP (TraB family)